MNESTILWIIGLAIGLAGALISAVWAYMMASQRAIWAAISKLTDQHQALATTLLREYHPREDVASLIQSSVEPMRESMRALDAKAARIEGLLLKVLIRDGHRPADEG